MKWIIGITVLVFVGWGCKDKAKEISDLPRVVIDLDRLPPITFEDLFAEAELVPLETADSCLLGIAYPLFEDAYYFMRENRQEKVTAYDQDGRFAFTISNQGAAPEQYRFLSEIAYNPYSKKLLLTESYDYIDEYDLQGNFIKKYALDSIRLRLNNVVPLGEDTLLIISGVKRWNYDFYSCKQNRILKHLEDPTYQMGRNVFYKQAGTHFHFKWWSNVVYRLADTAMVPAYVLDFGKYNPGEKDYASLFEHLYQADKVNEEKANEILVRNFSFLIRNLQGNNRFLFLEIMKLNGDLQKVERLSIVYDKRKGEARMLDADTRRMMNAEMSRLTETEYITFFESHEKDRLDRHVLDEKSRIVYDRLTDNDNPVIVRYKLK